jgi:hypothetical protein
VLLEGDRPIHQNDDQTPVLLTCPIRDDVGRHLAGPRRFGCPRARVELHRRERADGCRDTVVEHGEIRGGQPTHGLSLVVEDCHVELDQLYARSKLGQVALSLRQKTDRRQNVESDQNRFYAHASLFLTHGEAAVVLRWLGRMAGGPSVTDHSQC